MDAEGAVLATAALELEGLTRFKDLASNLFGETQLELSHAIHVTANQPVIGFVTTGDLNRNWMTALGLNE